MKRNLLLMGLLLAASVLRGQLSDTEAIRRLLHQQTEAWNRGDLEGFMQGYWKNDSLMFIGKSGITYGWAATLNNYRKGYPDTAAMGKLHFKLVELKRLSADYYFVTGHWELSRTQGNLRGMYTLLLRRIGKAWVIIRDHSS